MADNVLYKKRVAKENPRQEAEEEEPETSLEERRFVQASDLLAWWEEENNKMLDIKEDMEWMIEPLEEKAQEILVKEDSKYAKKDFFLKLIEVKYDELVFLKIDKHYNAQGNITFAKSLFTSEKVTRRRSML